MTFATSVGRRETSGRDRLLVLRLLLLGQLGGHVGLDEARGDDVRGDAARSELAGDGSRHAHEPGLRRGVVDLPGRAEQPDDAGDQDDAPELRLEHALRRALDDAEGAAEVGVDDLVEVVFAHAHQQRVAGDAGVRDDDLDRAEFCFDLGESGVERRGIRDVGAHRERALGALAGTGGDRDPVALGDESSAIARPMPRLPPVTRTVRAVIP